MKRVIRTYDKEFKLTAVRLAKENKRGIAKIARDLGVLRVYIKRLGKRRR